MKGNGKLAQIYQLDVHFLLFQGQSKDVADIDIRTILTTLKTWNPYLIIFITTSQMILKMHSIIHEYFLTTQERNILKIASEILLNRPLIRIDPIKFQYYSFIIDTIDTKLRKPEQTKQKKRIPNYTCTLKFGNRALKDIGLPLIFDLPEGNNSNFLIN